MIRYLTSLFIALTVISAPACAGKKIAVVVGQAGLSVTQGIGQLQVTTKQLTDSGVIPAPVALKVQEKLLALNDKAKPLPDILRRIDALSKAGSVDGTLVDQAISVLTVLATDMSVVIQGVPVSDAAKALLDVVVATQKTIATTLIEIAKLKGAA